MKFSVHHSKINLLQISRPQPLAASSRAQTPINLNQDHHDDN
jgi:hypothetical protein